jgi:mannose-6-phosphate isomerase-like protein (cupin superfamily)
VCQTRRVVVDHATQPRRQLGQVQLARQIATAEPSHLVDQPVDRPARRAHTALIAAPAAMSSGPAARKIPAIEGWRPAPAWAKLCSPTNLAARGAGSPLHVHRREDEWFDMIEGELTFAVGGKVITAPAGAFVYGPRDILHTFLVSSDEARFLLVTEPAGFEGFVRELAQPAPQLAIPPAITEPPDMARLAQIAAEHGVEILGPPGIPA